MSAPNFVVKVFLGKVLNTKKIDFDAVYSFGIQSFSDR